MLITLTGPGSRLYTQAGGGGGSDPLLPRDPEAGDIFVDLDSVSNGSGTEGSPYQPSQLTLTVWRSLTAGQQLVFMNGSGSGTYTPINLSALGSGTSSDRIVVRTYPGHSQANLTFGSGGASLVGGEYWDLYNLLFTVSRDGWLLGTAVSALGQGGSSGVSRHIRFIDCNGSKTSVAFTDNSGIICCANASSGGLNCEDVQILRGTYSGTVNGSNNQSLLWFDYMQDVQVVGCVLDQMANPIYFKHTSTTAEITAIVKNCIIRRAGRGIQSAVNWAQWTNCAFYNAKLAGDEEGGGTQGGNDWTVSHCTFAGASDWFMASEDADVRSRLTALNNVMVGTSRFFNAPLNSQDGSNTIDYSATTTGNHYRRNGSTMTRATYASTYSPNEANGVSGTISLDGGSAPGNSVSDWALASGSVGIGNASDSGDRGVNTTTLLTVN